MRFIGLVLCALLVATTAVHAQQARVYRIGVVLYGGEYAPAVGGLRNGLKELGMEEDRHFILHVRDVRGDLKAVEAEAKSLEREKVDVIFSVTTSVTLEVRRATQKVPVVFYAGADPVEAGIVKSYAKPGGRFTGVHSRSTPLVGKRLELLKEINPEARRVLFFHNPANPIRPAPTELAREAARQLNLQLAEVPVTSVGELRARLEALRPGEVDGITYVDGMVISQEPMILEATKAKGIPIVVANRASVAKGALASYGVSAFTYGRMAAKYVQRVLQGAGPGALPVEQVDRLHLAINLGTAKNLGLKVPQTVLLRADEVID